VQLNEVPLCGWCGVDLKDVDQEEYWRRGVEIWSNILSNRPLQETDGASGDAVIFERGRSRERNSTESIWWSKDAQGKQSHDRRRGFNQDLIRRGKGIEGEEKQTLGISIEPAHNNPRPSVPYFRIRVQQPRKWVLLLPGNRQVSHSPSEPSMLPSQTLGFAGNLPKSSTADPRPPAPELKGSTQNSTSASHMPLATVEHLSSLPPGERTARTQSIRQDIISPCKSPSPFPFFQNPRAPMVPSIDSSWGRCSRLPLDQTYPGFVHRISSHSGISQPELITTSEYMERHINPPQGDKEIKKAKVCIFCGQSSALDKFILGPNDKTYHCSCFVCRVCHERYNPAEENLDAYICFGAFPSHRLCVSNGADALLSKLQA
jgi:hypothetical protein